MGLNIGLYLRRSEGLIRKSEVLVRRSDVLVRTSDQEETKGICLCKQETRIEDSPIALVTNKWLRHSYGPPRSNTFNDKGVGSVEGEP